MRIELEVEGRDVQFVIINKADAADDQAKLTSRCSFPLFQDLDEVGAWDLHGGGKDDFFVFDGQGALAAYLPIDGEVPPPPAAAALPTRVSWHAMAGVVACMAIL